MAGTMAGTVIDVRSNQPIEGAAVSVQPGDHTTSAAPDGKWSLSLDAGQYALTVSSSGYDQFVAEDIHVLDDVTTDLTTALWPSEQ